MIIDPRGMTVIDWCSFMTLELSRLGPIPKLVDPDRWQEWALVVCGLPGLSQQHPPNPYSFGSWVDWVDAFNRTITFQG